MEKTKKPEEICIDHRNCLWFLYRGIAEQEILDDAIVGIFKTKEQKKEI